MSEYSRSDIKKAKNIAFLDGFEQGIVGARSFFDNLDTYSHESLVLHKLSTDPDLTAEVKECFDDWVNRMIDNCIISLVDKEVSENES